MILRTFLTRINKLLAYGAGLPRAIGQRLVLASVVIAALGCGGGEVDTVEPCDSGWISMASLETVSVPSDSTPLQKSVLMHCDLNIDWVEVSVQAQSDNTGDLRISITSPQGQTVDLLHPQFCGQAGCVDLSAEGGYLFNTAEHKGESADGSWTLSIRDEYDDNDTSALLGWRIVIHGR